jgi:phosphoglycolate phosphatase-like HAD superfamily hydrolase
MQIGRSLDEIDQKIKELNASLKQSQSNAKELDKGLKLDSKNTELAKARMKTLETAVGTAAQKAALLKQKQMEANKAMQNGDISAKEFDKISAAVLKAENEVRVLNAELKTATQSGTVSKINSLSKGFDGVTNSLKHGQNAMKMFSKMALAVVGAVASAIVNFTQATSELNDMARAYDLNIEKLQIQRGIYKEITGDADNYNKSLDAMKSVMNAITVGQGTGYANILKYLGIATTDLDGKTKSLSQVYEETINALTDMEDITLRNQLAYELFGEQAVSILEVMGLTSEELDSLTQKQIELGIVSNESAKSAEEITAQWESLKLSFMQVGAELAEKLMPLIQTLIKFAITYILPILTAIANWFGNMSPTGQKFVLFLLILVIILPKVISFITIVIGIIKAITIACYSAAGGVGAVSTASLPLVPIMLAVVAVVLTLALLFAFLTGKSKDLTKSLAGQQSQMDGITSSYADMGGEMDLNTSQIANNSNHTTTDINVTIDANGETPIAQENAELVADILADRINRELGGKI